MVFAKYLLSFFFCKGIEKLKNFYRGIITKRWNYSISNFSRVYLNITFQSMFNNDNWIISLNLSTRRRNIIHWHLKFRGITKPTNLCNNRHHLCAIKRTVYFINWSWNLRNHRREGEIDLISSQLQR